MLIQLRDYQKKSEDDLRQAFRIAQSVLYQLPTGGGKTFVFSYIAASAVAKGRKVLILVHRRELLSQASHSLAKIGLRHTLIAQNQHVREIMASHISEYNDSFIDLSAPIAIASVDTIVRRLHLFSGFDLIICDEAHHLTRFNKWGRVVAYFQNAKLLGVTATPIRADGKGLGDKYDGFFEALVCGPTMRELIQQKYLLPPVVFSPPSDLDLTGIKIHAGDYAAGELSLRLSKSTITGDAIKTYQKICPGVPAIAFCVSIEEAKRTAAEARAAGIRAFSIDGTMHDNERRGLIQSLAKGQIDWLTSCDLISEGTDIPVVGCGILLRPTKSEGLYLQQVGRILRPSEGQTKAYILDHVGNVGSWVNDKFITNHGLPDADREWSLEGIKRRGKNNNVKNSKHDTTQCAKCLMVYPISPACPYCGNEPISGRGVSKVDGELRQIDAQETERLRKQHRLMRISEAKTLEDLLKVAKEIGHKPGWAHHLYRARMKTRARA